MTQLTAASVFADGGIIAYPTEAVFGLGCDPDNSQAIKKLLALKQRPQEKGLILLAGNYSQLLPYVDDNAIPQDKRFSVLSRWPDGITQVLPAKPGLSELLTGQFTSIAVRVTSQPDVVALCQATGKPIVSTSANLTGQPPATTWQQVEQGLGEQVDFIIKGETLGFTKPSTIIDALTGETFRQ
ncbi:L-threonylcarbamoyladenylate synthase [Thalassotalea mangrovi]|uniref:Threonylcarbamoyl-AMP synthase n=1 Tax=Thalassotalea mangrovi TaxID=2572245 RepID=A0A4U1B8Y5_9GAMM|nr:L-threonylcarbamoyladenylate synthase [Thalassotalea mangrovi]TKB46436.1 threonylcarbamoyl-AMP synthase [Thalassotalea mangrovi]